MKYPRIFKKMIAGILAGIMIATSLPSDVIASVPVADEAQKEELETEVITVDDKDSTKEVSKDESMEEDSETLDGVESEIKDDDNDSISDESTENVLDGKSDAKSDDEKLSEKEESKDTSLDEEKEESSEDELEMEEVESEYKDSEPEYADIDIAWYERNSSTYQGSYSNNSFEVLAYGYEHNYDEIPYDSANSLNNYEWTDVTSGSLPKKLSLEQFYDGTYRRSVGFKIRAKEGFSINSVSSRGTSGATPWMENISDSKYGDILFVGWTISDLIEGETPTVQVDYSKTKSFSVVVYLDGNKITEFGDGEEYECNLTPYFDYQGSIVEGSNNSKFEFPEVPDDQSYNLRLTLNNDKKCPESIYLGLNGSKTVNTSYNGTGFLGENTNFIGIPGKYATGTVSIIVTTRTAIKGVPVSFNDAEYNYTVEGYRYDSWEGEWLTPDDESDDYYNKVDEADNGRVYYKIVPAEGYELASGSIYYSDDNKSIPIQEYDLRKEGAYYIVPVSLHGGLMKGSEGIKVTLKTVNASNIRTVTVYEGDTISENQWLQGAALAGNSSGLRYDYDTHKYKVYETDSDLHFYINYPGVGTPQAASKVYYRTRGTSGKGTEITNEVYANASNVEGVCYTVPKSALTGDVDIILDGLHDISQESTVPVIFDNRSEYQVVGKSWQSGMGWYPYDNYVVAENDHTNERESANSSEYLMYKLKPKAGTSIGDITVTGVSSYKSVVFGQYNDDGSGKSTAYGILVIPCYGFTADEIHVNVDVEAGETVVYSAQFREDLDEYLDLKIKDGDKEIVPEIIESAWRPGYNEYKYTFKSGKKYDVVAALNREKLDSERINVFINHELGNHRWEQFKYTDDFSKIEGSFVAQNGAWLSIVMQKQVLITLMCDDSSESDSYFKVTKATVNGSAIQPVQSVGTSIKNYLVAVPDADYTANVNFVLNGNTAKDVPVNVYQYANGKDGEKSILTRAASRTASFDFDLDFETSKPEYVFDIETVNCESKFKIVELDEDNNPTATVYTCDADKTVLLERGKDYRVSVYNKNNRQASIESFASKLSTETKYTKGGEYNLNEEVKTFDFTTKGKTGQKLNFEVHTDTSNAYGDKFTVDVTKGITKINCTAVKTVTNPYDKNDKYLAISQEINTTKEYAYTLLSGEATSTDASKLSIRVLDHDGNELDEESIARDLVASINTDTKKIRIETPLEMALTKFARIQVINDVEDSVVLDFYLDTTGPAWVKTKPTFKYVSSTDTTITFDVAPPKGVELNDNFYYELCLGGTTKTEDRAPLQVRYSDGHYFKANDTSRITFNVFKDISKTPGSDGYIVTEPGDGYAATFDAQLKLVLYRDGVNPAEDSNAWIARSEDSSGMAKLANVSTKNPYYSDKITIKGVNTKLYAGRENVKVATVDLGKNTTFNRTDDWTAVALDSNGAITDYIRFKPNTENIYDNGVYFDVDEDTPSGKYTIVVSTTPGRVSNAMPVKATLAVTVQDTVRMVMADYKSAANVKQLLTDGTTPEAKVYKNAKSVASITVVPRAIQQDGLHDMKGVKYNYALYDCTDGYDFAANQPRLITDKNVATVSTSGVVSIKSNDVTKYGVLISAASGYVEKDYNESSPYEVEYELGAPSVLAKIDVDSSDISITADSVTPYIASPGDIDYDAKAKAYVVKYSDIKELIKSGTGLQFEVMNASNSTPLDAELYTITCSDKNGLKADTFTKAAAVTYTVKTINGKSVTVKINVGYSDDVYTNLKLDPGDGTEPVNLGSTTMLKDDACSLSAYPLSQEYTLWLADESGNKAIDDLVNASISISGGTIIKGSSIKNQQLKFKVTSALTTITVTRGKFKTIYYVANDNAALNAAPTATQQTKVYADYQYADDGVIRFKLNAPIKVGVKETVGKTTKTVQKVVAAENVTARFDATNSDMSFASFKYPEYVIEYDSKGNPVAYVELKFDGAQKITKAGTYKIYLEYANGSFDDDGSLEDNSKTEYTAADYLTKSTTALNLKVEAYKMAGSHTASYTMSIRDKISTNLIYKETGTFKSEGYAVVYAGEGLGISNSNDKGVYSNFTGLFDIDSDGVLSMDREAVNEALAAGTIKDGSKINGYVTYKVVYPSGIEVTKSDKITVSFVAKTGTYKTDKCAVLKGADSVGTSIYNGKLEAGVIAAKIIPSKTGDPVSDVSCDGTSKMTFTLATESMACKSYTVKLRVIPSAGICTSVMPTDDEWNLYGVDVSVVVDVKDAKR